MKIKVNKEQLNLLKEFIQEARVKEYPRGIKSKLGKQIINLLDNISLDKITEFILADGSTVELECVSDKNYIFAFKIIKDDKHFFGDDYYTSIYINPGNGDSDSTENEYELNKKIIKPASNSNYYTLIFKYYDNYYELPDIAKVNLINSNSEDLKPIDLDKEPDDESSDNETKNNELKSDAKTAYERILNDPKLKDAFYKQPNFWQMFKSELTGKKPVGSGIITALDILDRYDLRYFHNKINKNLVNNKMVTVKFLDNYDIDFGKDKRVVFDKDKEYKTIIRMDNNGRKFLNGRENGVNFYLSLDKPLNNMENTFLMKKNGREYAFSIITDNEKSPGFIS